MKFLHEFCRYGNGQIEDNGWWKISSDGKRLINRHGGGHDYIPSDNDIICEVDHWEDLDYSYLLKPDSPYGWIDREGKWYGCRYMQHDDVAELVLHTSSRELEENGWIKIFRTWNCQRDAYIDYQNGIRGRVTEQQLKTLVDIGMEDCSLYRHCTYEKE